MSLHRARGVIAARDAGRFDDRLAAAALVDLAAGSGKLVCAGVLEAAGVRAGRVRTPGGILPAA